MSSWSFGILLLCMCYDHLLSTEDSIFSHICYLLKIALLKIATVAMYNLIMHPHIGQKGLHQFTYWQDQYWFMYSQNMRHCIHNILFNLINTLPRNVSNFIESTTSIFNLNYQNLNFKIFFKYMTLKIHQFPKTWLSCFLIYSHG